MTKEQAMLVSAVKQREAALNNNIILEAELIVLKEELEKLKNPTVTK